MSRLGPLRGRTLEFGEKVLEVREAPAAMILMDAARILKRRRWMRNCCARRSAWSNYGWPQRLKPGVREAGSSSVSASLVVAAGRVVGHWQLTLAVEQMRMTRISARQP
jgi:hypothetical protein